MPHFPLNADMIQIIMPITTTTAMMPTAKPALKIPVITEQPLSTISANANNKIFNFFMVRLIGLC